MFTSLKDNLANIETLRQYYISTNNEVIKQAEKGKNENRLAHLIDIYMASLLSDKLIPEEVKQELKDYVEKYIEVINVDKEKKLVQYKTKAEAKGIINNHTDVQECSMLFMRYDEMPRIHATNTLITLITRFEEAISDFLHDLFMYFPDKYLNDKQVKYSEVINKSPEEVTEYVIRHEIEGIMWKSHVEWLKLFESHKLCFKACQKQINELNEIYARRNIWIHNSGKVNESYLNAVKESKRKIGEQLTVDKQYLSHAFLCIKSIIFVLYTEAIKFHTEDRQDYIKWLFEIAYDELVKKDYALCDVVFPEFTNCDYADEETKTMAKVNCWISKKAQGHFQKIKEEIERFDISAKSKLFKLAKLILLEKYDEATEFLEASYDLDSTESVGPYELCQWPLFIDYRKTEQYHAFREKHHEDFKTIQIEETKTEKIEIPT